ncbi:21 kDa protein [Phtheirospermum japonicum]|uniref:21 kDa protein n=1 Tax=Phtheirospermum japonicum TaxID=374723 RepID=A0A830CL13_9LAMI|nr:21 kDa protein [Phtheirospermum japonicum]
MQNDDVPIPLRQNPNPLRLRRQDQPPEALHHRARGGRTGDEELLRRRLGALEAEGAPPAGGAGDQGVHRRPEGRRRRPEADGGRHGAPPRRRQGVPVGEREDVRQRRHHRRGHVS